MTQALGYVTKNQTGGYDRTLASGTVGLTLPRAGRRGGHFAHLVAEIDAMRVNFSALSQR